MKNLENARGFLSYKTSRMPTDEKRPTDKTSRVVVVKTTKAVMLKASFLFLAISLTLKKIPPWRDDIELRDFPIIMKNSLFCFKCNCISELFVFDFFGQ